jgi:hypothetical protein
VALESAHIWLTAGEFNRARLPSQKVANAGRDALYLLIPGPIINIYIIKVGVLLLVCTWWFKHPRWDLTPPFQFTRRIAPAKHENMNIHSIERESSSAHTKDNAGSYLTASLITAAAGRLNYAQTCGKNIKLHHPAQWRLGAHADAKNNRIYQLLSIYVIS